MTIRTRSLFTQLTSGFSLLALLLSPAALSAAGTTAASPFTQAKIDDLVGNVSIISKSDPTNLLPAKLQDVLKAPDTLKTGARSRVELKSEDGTIARVGSNTAFSLEENGRTINLTQGSILFNSPKGMGGGTIVTKGATATVLGTTVIVTATSNGGFKILVMEGHASITYPGGLTVNLGPGQMTFVMPGSTSSSSTGGTTGGSTGGTPGPVLNFDLDRQTAGSDLLNGFTIVLPSNDLILDASRGQQIQIKNGELVQTDKAIVGAISSTQVVLVDQSTLTAAIDAQHSTTPSNGNDRLTQALASTLNLSNDSSTFPDLNIFLDPTTVSSSRLGIPSGLIKNDSLVVTGAVAGNINISGGIVPGIAPLLGGNLDLSQFQTLNEIDLLAGKNFTFTDDTFINVPEGTNILALYAGGSFVIPNDIEIGADKFFDNSIVTPAISSGNLLFRMASVGVFSLNDNYIYNDYGNLEIDTLTGDVNIANSTLEVDRSRSTLSLSSLKGSVNLTDSTVQMNSRGTFSVSAGGGVTLENSTVQFSDGGTFYYSYIKALGNIAIANSTVTATRDLNAFGGAQLLLNNFGPGFGEPEYEFGAKTVVVKNTAFYFADSLTFYSATGHVNFLGENDTPIVGDINILGNVTDDGDPLVQDENFSTGITADNADVQAALATTVTIPSGNFSEGQFFNQVVFTPANIANFTTDHVYDPYFAESVLVAGTLNISGNAIIDSGDINQVIVGHLNITGSTNLTLTNTGFTDVVSLGTASFAAGSTININLPDSEGNSDFEFESLAPFQVSHVTINQLNGELEFYGYANNGVALGFESATLTANSYLYFESVGEGDINISNSTLTASENDELEVFTDYSTGAINIKNSTLTAGYIELETGDDENFYTGDLNVINSTFTTNGTEESGIDLYGNRLLVSNSTLQANNNGSIYGEGQSGVLVDNSTISSEFDNVEFDAETGNNTISHSTLTAPDDEISLYAYGTGGTINVLSSNLTADSDIYIENQPRIDSSDLTLFGNVVIQGSNLTSTDDYIEVYAGYNLTITNSTLFAGDGEIYLQSDNGNILIQGSNLTSNDSYVDLSADSNDNQGISIINSTLLAGDSDIEFDANGDVLIQGSNLTSPNDSIYFNGSTISVINSFLTGNDNEVNLNADSAITVQGSTLQGGPGGNSTGYISLSAGDVVTVINSTLIATNVSISTNPNGNSTINLNSVAMANAQDINISSHTVNLSNINFPSGSTVSLGSGNGLLAPNPNTGAQPVMGYVNYVTNVQYNSQPAQNFTYVPNNPGSSGSSSSPSAPIQIYSNNR